MQVDRALTSLAGEDGQDAEVHLILSVRDLVRQIPAEWQENVKHRSTISYAKFLEQITDPARESRIGSWFWGVQEIPDIINRWGASVPPERIHLVTVPAPGAPRDELWRRFSQAFGLDGLDLDLTPERANPSLGVAETALLRRINREVVKTVDPADYRPLVRELLAHQTLSRRAGSPRLTLPPHLHAWAGELSATWVEEIERRGYDVVGDLRDLLGAPLGSAEEQAAWADPDHPRRRPGLPRGGGRDLRAAHRDRPAAPGRGRPQPRAGPTREALERSYLRPSYRLRERAGPAAGGDAARARAADGLPAGPGQELLVGVATGTPGGVAVGAGADQATDHRDPPTGGGGQPLAGHLGQDHLGDLGGDDHAQRRGRAPVRLPAPAGRPGSCGA